MLSPSPLVSKTAKVFASLVLISAAVFASLLSIGMSLPLSASGVVQFKPVAPLLPDTEYMPVQYRGKPSRHRHPKGWTRQMDLRGELIQDLSGVDIEELPPYQACDVMVDAFEKYGMNGAAERFATEDGHALGHVFAHYALKRHVDPVKYFHDSKTLCIKGQEISFDSARPTRCGQYHGSIVQWLGEYAYKLTHLGLPGYEPPLDWDFILDTVCAGSDPDYEYRQFHFCMHGVGHAIGYKNLFWPRTPPTVCLPEPTPQIRDSRHAFEGFRLCNTVPYPQLARLCGVGLWHGYFEYTVGEYPLDFSTDPHGPGVPVKDYLWPCSVLDKFTSHCFGQIFAFLGRGDWRFDDIRNASASTHHGLVEVCLGRGMPEINVQGCIYGLSSAFFPVYDKIVAARTEADLYTPPTIRRVMRPSEGGLWGSEYLNAYDMAIFDSKKSDYMWSETYGPPEAHGHLLIDGGVVPPTHSQTTLTSWCSNFVGDAPFSGKITDIEYMRWKSCVAGAFDWAAVMTWLSIVEPQETRGRWCPQMLEVPFLAHEQRNESYELCKQMTRPAPGGYKTWGSLVPELV